MFARSAAVCAALSLALASAGCASKRGVETVWAMPGVMQPDADPGKEGSGYPFAYGPQGGGGADHLEAEPHPGDLPETRFVGPRGIWRSDESRARAEARDLGLGLVVAFWAEWCDECWRLERETFRDPQLIATLRSDFVPLFVDVTEETFVAREQLERYRVNRLPTILVLGPKGRELERIEQFVSADELARRLRNEPPARKGQLARDAR